MSCPSENVCFYQPQWEVKWIKFTTIDRWIVFVHILFSWILVWNFHFIMLDPCNLYSLLKCVDKKWGYIKKNISCLKSLFIISVIDISLYIFTSISNKSENAIYASQPTSELRPLKLNVVLCYANFPVLFTQNFELQVSPYSLI